MLIWFDLPLWSVLGFLMILGMVIGSFLNVCVHRLPIHENIWKAWGSLSHPPSRCPRCFTAILPRDNIPLLGWLILRGRCRACQNPISFRYPAIELLNGLLFILVYWLEVPHDRLGLTLPLSSLFTPLGPTGIVGSEWLSPQAVVLWRYAFHMVLVEALLVASLIDIDLRIIPDSVTLPAMVVGVLGNTLLGRVHLIPIWYQRSDLRHFLMLFTDGEKLPGWLDSLTQWWIFSGQGVPQWCAQSPHWHGLALSLAGLVVGGGLIWVIRIIGHRVMRQEAMGFGDVVLMAMIGSFIGWQATVVLTVFAAITAMIWALSSMVFLRDRYIPFGPFLSFGALVTLLSWRWIWPTVSHFLELGPLLPVLALFMAVWLYLLLHLTQFIKWCLGFELYPPEWIEEWTSADQLTYQSGENVDPQQGNWRQTGWPGHLAGRGQTQQETWQRQSSSPQNSTWNQNWQRRQP